MYREKLINQSSAAWCPDLAAIGKYQPNCKRRQEKCNNQQLYFFCQLPKVLFPLWVISVMFSPGLTIPPITRSKLNNNEVLTRWLCYYCYLSVNCASINCRGCSICLIPLDVGLWQKFNSCSVVCWCSTGLLSVGLLFVLLPQRIVLCLLRSNKFATLNLYRS